MHYPVPFPYITKCTHATPINPLCNQNHPPFLPINVIKSIGLAYKNKAGTEYAMRGSHRYN